MAYLPLGPGVVGAPRPATRESLEATPGAMPRADRLTMGRAVEYAQVFAVFLVGSYALSLQPDWQAKAWLLLYAGFLVLFVLHYRSFLEAIGKSRLLLCWPALALLSTSWTEAPEQTLRFAVQLLMTVLISIYIGARFTLGQITWIVFATLGATALACLAAIFLELPFAWDHNGLVRGIFPHKNALGGRMVFLLVCCLVILLSGRFRSLAAVTAPIAILLVWWSQSGTAILMTAVVLGLTPLLLLRRNAPVLTLLAGFALLAVASLLFWATLSFGVDPVGLLLTALGKEQTLTGRSLLWDFAQGLIAERPLLGHGYSAIWIADPASFGAFVQSVMRQEIQNFHNSYLDILVQLGAVGLLATAALLLWFAVNAVRALASSHDFARALPCYVAVFVLLYSLSEYAIFRQHSFIQLLLGAVSVALAVKLDRRRGGEAGEPKISS